MELKVKLFADGADKEGMLEMNANPIISGFTTNPTLMKVAGVDNYKSIAKDILAHINEYDTIYVYDLKKEIKTKCERDGNLIICGKII